MTNLASETVMTKVIFFFMTSGVEEIDVDALFAILSAVSLPLMPLCAKTHKK